LGNQLGNGGVALPTPLTKGRGKKWLTMGQRIYQNMKMGTEAGEGFFSALRKDAVGSWEKVMV